MLLCVGAGSDAGSLTTSAKLSSSKDEYIVNGNKAFISGTYLLTVSINVNLFNISSAQAWY